MNILEQSEGLNFIERESRREALNMAASVIAENFGNESSASHIGDRDLLKRVSESSGKISGRTAIITEKVLVDYVRRLRSDIGELKRKIANDRNANVEEAEAEIEAKKAQIKVIEGNCLNSLGSINDSILFPSE